MAVLERSELEASPLADLHAIADQIGLDGFRRLRKADLIDAILGEKSDSSTSSDNGSEDEEESPRPRRRRSPRARRAAGSAAKRGDGGGGRGEARRRRRLRHGGRLLAHVHRRCATQPRRQKRTRRRGPLMPPRAPHRSAGEDGETSDAGGLREHAGASRPRASSRCSATAPRFLRVDPPEPSDEDVYISAAQVRRCELVSRRPRDRPGAHAAPLRALPVAGSHRHDQRHLRRRGLRRRAATRTCR